MKKTFLLLALTFPAISGLAQASLPFSYDGGKSTLPSGLTQSGLGTDYASSPHLKHDNTGDYLVLHYTGAAGSLSFAIRYYGGSNDTLDGNFLLQLSDDGISYNTIKLYGDTTGGILLTNANTHYDTITGIPATTQYVRWLYSSKISGNIGIGAISLDGSSPTPLHLISFSGNATMTGNRLDWQIAEARNISGFVVEQATDGKRFQEIGLVSYNNGQEKFRFMDVKNHHQNDFYRLKIMDINHRFTYSPVIAINNNLLPSLDLFCSPNPVHSTLYIKAGNSIGAAKVYLTDLPGKILLEQNIIFQSETAIPISLENLPPGVYFIKIQTGNQARQFKIIKQ
ncbi:MAG TPA: T9SS type A sorting domain-containing protein [Edaphocola sp.]|nr:T9SS type A sorting domain-containing protein [Edaphocola sp.]